MLTTTGMVMGSPGFMSPEQASGQREVGEPTDVFSLGAVLAFAATGIGPFGDGPTPALLYRVVNEEPDLTHTPDRLRPLIERCLAKNPADRPAPADMFELLSDTVGAVTGEWPPKSVADTIRRYSPAAESSAFSALVPEPLKPASTSSRADGDAGPSGPSVGATPEPLPTPTSDRPDRESETTTTTPPTPRTELASSAQMNGGQPWAATGQKTGVSEASAAIPAPRSSRPPEPVALDVSGRGSRPQAPSPSASRMRRWRWPASVAAAIIAAAVLATVLVASSGHTPNPQTDPTPSLARITTRPTASPSVTAVSSKIPVAVKPATNPATMPSVAISQTRASSQNRASPIAAHSASSVAAAPYASGSLGTGSSSVTARYYFGELSAVVDALAGLGTFNTNATLAASEPGVCVETVVFSQVADATGVVGAEGLGSGWTSAEGPPGQDTQDGHLHQQLVVPPTPISAGESWQASAELISGGLQLQSSTYSVTLQTTAGSAQTWLIDGHAVSCDAR